MSQVAMNAWPARYLSLMSGDSTEEITLVRSVRWSPGVVRLATEGDGAVWLDPADVLDDGVEAENDGVISAGDLALVAAVEAGPVILGQEMRRRLQRIADRMREVDFASPRGRGRCARHQLEGRIRRLICELTCETAKFDADW